MSPISKVMVAVHPRVCGEHASNDAGTSYAGGSSPRLRGTQVDAGIQPVPVRFIPASAGNTSGYLPSQPAGAVHPRVCGEHRNASRNSPRSCGSSPRLRGTLFIKVCNFPVLRFIPASAGNTSSGLSSASIFTVHPRVCGEHLRRRNTMTGRFGSSPRLRGTRGLARHGEQKNRFIPASAGNTAAYLTAIIACSVHPRVCGEHIGQRLEHEAAVGSSPRLRGTPQLFLQCIPQRRFIPASAGNTVCSEVFVLHSSVHPRVCGEHFRG